MGKEYGHYDEMKRNELKHLKCGCGEERDIVKNMAEQVSGEVCVENDCVVEGLLKVPFNRRTYNEKVEIGKMERLTPELNLSMGVKEKQREYTRHLTSTSYVLKHDKSKAHICSSMNFANFGKTRVDLQLDKQKALHINQHNTLVKKNRVILPRLINAACFLGEQELAFRGHNESVESDSRGKYIEYLSSLSEFDHLLANHLESSTVFRGTSPAIHNDLIFAISGVMIKNIKSEIEAPFVAIVVDETSDCSNQSQLSTVLRYVDSTANVQERFIGFTNVSSGKTAAALFKHVESVIAEYNVGNKLIARTYDGASVMAGNINGLKTKVQEKENFPNEALNKLFQSYNSHFDQVRLKNELSVIYSAEVFDFTNKPIHEILSAIYENQLNQVIPEVLKLATLIVTISATSASVERTFSALKRIKSYCRSTHTQERLSGLALMSIEKSFLQKLRKRPNCNFNDEVINQVCVILTYLPLSFGERLTRLSRSERALFVQFYWERKNNSKQHDIVKNMAEQVSGEVCVENDCVVEGLLKVPFNRRTYNEKVEIGKMERLTPELNLSMGVKEKQREYTRHFTSTSYVLKHDKSKAHICSSMNFANFGKTRVDLQLDKQKALHINQHNTLVKKNRVILPRLINAACFLGKQELAFRGYNESVESDSRGKYIEYLSSLSEFDHLLANHLESSTVFRGTSPAIHNDLIFAISGVMIKNIKSEIEAPFVAIVVDETSDCSNQSQLSTVLRYVDSTANVQERFIGFTNVSSGKTAAALFKHVESVIAEYNVGNKLIARTYDGASVMAGNINGLKTRVQENENFPNEALNKLFQSYNSHFDQVRLKNELSVIYSAEVFDFTNKPIHEILSAIYENQLNQVIPEVLKLATLIVTISATSASVERTFSALKRIKSYCRSTHTQERLSGLALMSIEKSFLQKLRKRPNCNFNDEVINIPPYCTVAVASLCHSDVFSSLFRRAVNTALRSERALFVQFYWERKNNSKQQMRNIYYHEKTATIASLRCARGSETRAQRASELAETTSQGIELTLFYSIHLATMEFPVTISAYSESHRSGGINDVTLERK
ncbi:hypothetical protein ANN_26130 [Periplaneta americana]|uniref:Zinc finger MYM-type protein 1 n=1 Tax=Periplaneta americana TaxID=6978 RepID=A0ABQ8S526_PERAM|nr:hypothetical protein ANN_26130 [Periplaneta americana]